MKDWIDSKGRLHRFLGVKDGRAHFKVEVPSTVVRTGFDPLAGGDSATYYSSTDDGVLVGYSNESYTAARSTCAFVVNDSEADTVGQAHLWDLAYEEWVYLVWRVALYFDTSDMPNDASISEAAVRFYSWMLIADRTFDIVVVAYTGSKPATTDDWDELGSTSYGSLPSNDWEEDAYNDIPLNSTGRSAINKTGWTCLGVRTSREIAADEVGTETWEVAGLSLGEAGGERAPKLTVTYSVPVVDVTLTPPPGWLTIGTGTPFAGVATLVTAPPGYFSLWPTSPSTIAGTGVIFDAPPGHFTIFPGRAVHEAPHLPFPLKVSRTRPSHWFSSRRDIVRK